MAATRMGAPPDAGQIFETGVDLVGLFVHSEWEGLKISDIKESSWNDESCHENAWFLGP